MKRSFFQAAVTSILLYGCTTWTLTKRLEKKLDGNYTRMLRAILNKSWQQHPTRHQLYGHLPPITKTIQVRRTRHAGHCWRSRDELIRDVLLWIPTHGRAKAGRPARTYIQQLCEDTGCCPEDLPRAMNDWEEWRERVRDIRATSAIWWWWWWISARSFYFKNFKHVLLWLNIQAYLYVCVCVWLWVGHRYTYANVCVCVCPYRGHLCLSIYTGQPGSNAEVNQLRVENEGICHWKRGENNAGGETQRGSQRRNTENGLELARQFEGYAYQRRHTNKLRRRS